MTIKTHGRMFTDSTVGITQLAVNDGTDGQALVTDGSGTLRFATVGAGGSVGSSVYVEDTRTGDGSAVTFNLSTAVPYEESIFVFIDGIAQPTTAYTLPTTTSITFSSAPITGVTIRICHLGIASSVADNGITGAKIAMGADVAGDVLYYNGTDYQRLGIGTASQHLATNSGANAPEWVTPTAASTTASGTVEIATQAEVNTGTDTTRSITPATLAAKIAASAGKVVKIWHTNSTAQFTTSTSLTFGSPPDSSSGLLILDLPVTASAVGNKLLFHFHAMLGSPNLTGTATCNAAFALFRTSGPNALNAALFATSGHVNGAGFGSWHTVESALTTTQSNYRVKMGKALIPAVTNYDVSINKFNNLGPSPAPNFGAASKCSLTIIEYIP
jgi:hypothetical protein